LIQQLALVKQLSNLQVQVQSLSVLLALVKCWLLVLVVLVITLVAAVAVVVVVTLTIHPLFYPLAHLLSQLGLAVRHHPKQITLFLDYLLELLIFLLGLVVVAVVILTVALVALVVVLVALVHQGLGLQDKEIVVVVELGTPLGAAVQEQSGITQVLAILVEQAVQVYQILSLAVRQSFMLVVVVVEVT
jgi:hypothetical protein